MLSKQQSWSTWGGSILDPVSDQHPGFMHEASNILVQLSQHILITLNLQHPGSIEPAHSGSLEPAHSGSIEPATFWSHWVSNILAPCSQQHFSSIESATFSFHWASTFLVPLSQQQYGSIEPATFWFHWVSNMLVPLSQQVWFHWASKPDFIEPAHCGSIDSAHSDSIASAHSDSIMLATFWFHWASMILVSLSQEHSGYIQPRTFCLHWGSGILNPLIHQHYGQTMQSVRVFLSCMTLGRDEHLMAVTFLCLTRSLQVRPSAGERPHQRRDPGPQRQRLSYWMPSAGHRSKATVRQVRTRDVTCWISQDTNTRRWTSVGLMMGHRRRRWTSIKTTVDQRLEFSETSGILTYWKC